MLCKCTGSAIVTVGNPSGGLLDNHADPPSTFRPVAAGSNTSVIGISIDWGNISSTPEPAVWAFGVYRNPTMRHLTPKGSSENRSPFFVSEISDPVAAAKFVLDDFPRASFAAQALDARIRADGEAFSTEYADLLMLSARQAMGSMDITIPPSLSGSWDTSDVKIFMKNLGGVGSDNEAMTSVNNVDALYAAFPVFLYLNPEIGRCLLEPLFEFQDSPAYKLPYAARNIGTAYPSATANGINDQHIYGVDETASMIIMTLAYSMASGNGTLIERHYNLMRSWAFYLGNNTVTPSNQASGDFSINADFTSPNQTNLALKGIIGIAAMARIAELAGIVIDQQSFNATANSALEFWQDQALSTSHVNFFYGNSSSSGLMYNLYADKLLRLNLVPDSVYTLLTGFYQNEAASFKYGIPLSNSPMQNTTTYWMMFAAATAKNDTTRDLLVKQIHAYASNNLNAAPFQSRYDPITGLSGPGTSATTAGIASPAQGGMFALLALNTTSKPVKVSSIDPSPNESPASLKMKAGLIAGLAVAGVAVIAISSLGLYFFLRKRRARQDEIRIATSRIETSGFAHPFILPPPTSEAHTYRAITSNSALISHNAPISIPSGPTNFPRGAHLQWEGERGTDKKREPAMTNATESQTRRPTEANVQVGTDRLQGVDALLSEVDAMRQEIERMRHERRAAEDAPPTYSDPDLS
ncbi:DUF1793-domain-containing protein [Fomitiporia mediterranea MF3/22]|uniref:DUF1793-domain-containing protein n=1 Tax=Fomitiporia mediterranea (strain MF3/22) TaxID=694068 RepID=UPI000440860F|nr:DUF1793-domain-containing protein [Fomitiporia mediterranea MF3/22]EJC98579.1 DUF1793-domain-containing protein [Fomitiporia mediterranea MF3/22]